MDFIEGLLTYFQRILDPASYIVAGLFSLALTILFFPNHWTKRAVLKVLLIKEPRVGRGSFKPPALRADSKNADFIYSWAL